MEKNSINFEKFSIESKKELIETIQKTIGIYNTKEQSILIQNLFKIISTDIYSEERRFIAEIIQNSDDASVSNRELRISIYFFNKHILIGHHGKEFDDNDVRSICYAGDSTKKKDKNTTGYKGIGFKSVFTHAKKVFIISGGFQFRFEENSDKAKQYAWQIYPIWSTEEDLGDVEIFQKAKDFKVGIIIELKNQKIFQECKNFFLEFKHDQNYLLFLKCPNVEIKIFENKIETLRIKKNTYKDNHDKFIIKCMDKTSENSQNLDKEANSGAASIKENKENIGSKEEILLNCYFIKKYICDMEKEDYISKEDLQKIFNDDQIPSKLKDLKSLEIWFAVKLDKDGKSILSLDKSERIIYSYLPTKVNYNFPFLINSNLILDAGRSLIKDHIFNKCLFSVLPKYIGKFQEDVRESFFNQYALLLVKDVNIDNKNFEKIFSQNLEIEKSYYSQKICMYSQKNIRKDFRECFCEELACDNSFNNSNKQKQINNKFIENSLGKKKPVFNNFKENRIIDFLLAVIEKQEVKDKLERILKKFFKEKKGIKYEDENRIVSQDIEYVRNIADYYKVETKVKFLNFDDLIEFLKSDYYKEIYSASFLFKMLDKLKKTSFLSKFENIDLKILKNNCGEFISSINAYYYENPVKEEGMIISNLNNNNNNYNSLEDENQFLESENTGKKGKKNAGKISKKDSDKQDIKQNDFDKFLLSYEIYELFASENKLGLLNTIGVKSQSSNEQVENIMKNIETYNENNSYKILKLLFDQWRISQPSERKKYIEVLKFKNLHTKNKGFIHPHCVILGKTFCADKNFDQFSDWFLNERYWNYFFEEDLKKPKSVLKAEETNQAVKTEADQEMNRRENDLMEIDEDQDQVDLKNNNSENENEKTNNLNKLITNKQSSSRKERKKSNHKTQKKLEIADPIDKKEKELKKQLSKNFNDFRDFFKELDIWIEPISYFYLFSKENFIYSPFIDRKFIELNKKMFENDYRWYLFTSPYLVNLYERSFEDIAMFFKSYVINMDDEELDKYKKKNYFDYFTSSQKEIKKKKLFDDCEENFEDFEKNNAIKYKYGNYFKWYFEENGKRVPTMLNTVEKVENIFSHQIIKRIENDDIKNIYFETLSFCYNHDIWERLGKIGFKFKEKLDLDNYQNILRSLYKKYTELANETKENTNNNINLDNVEKTLLDNESRRTNRKATISFKNFKSKERSDNGQKGKENFSKEKLKVAIKTEYKLILDIIYSLNINRKLDDEYDEKNYIESNSNPLLNRNYAAKVNSNSMIYLSSFIRHNCRNIELIDKSEIESNNYKSKMRKFFKLNSIDVASESDHEICYDDLVEETDFTKYWIVIREKLFNFFRIDNEKKQTNICLFSTEDLKRRDIRWGDCEEVIFHQELINNQKENTLKLIYQKDEFNFDWKQPCILYLIANSICSHLGLVNQSGILITIFNLIHQGKTEYIDYFLQKIE